MSRGRILFIDDSLAVLARVRVALSEAGFTVEATDQTVGIARHLGKVELVIIDYHMPGRDGMVVLDSLRAAARELPEPPAFFLFTSDETISHRARALGFDGGIDRKGDDEALVRQVDAALRLLRIRRMRKA